MEAVGMISWMGRSKPFLRIGEMVKPTHAITMTIPALMQAAAAFVIVPGARKADAVRHTLYDPVSERNPSTILRRHQDARLFLDKESAIYVEK
jgi:glucosamine-6-phosphate deaminase